MVRNLSYSRNCFSTSLTSLFSTGPPIAIKSVPYSPKSAMMTTEVRTLSSGMTLSRQDSPACLSNEILPQQPNPDTDTYARGARDSAYGGSRFQPTGEAALSRALAEYQALGIPYGGPLGVQALASQLIQQDNLEDTFYIIDLGNVLRMYKVIHQIIKLPLPFLTATTPSFAAVCPPPDPDPLVSRSQAWCSAMPRITPYYAVKCNPEPGMLRLLNAAGAGFDCASQGELEMVLKMGVDPDRIIFAHPTKRASDIRFARHHNVHYTTFDTISELHKIASLNPDGFKCVLRIRADDPDARVQLGLKYGAEVAEAESLLLTAMALGLKVVGVSFHVGSGCSNLATYAVAIRAARGIFDIAESLGFKMELIDIGGGFTGHFDEQGNVKFGQIADAINSSIDELFPADSGVRVIAEPGRYFAETAASLFTPVYGQRDRLSDNGDGSVKSKDYWLTDGVYGSFNCMIYDAQSPAYRILRAPLLPLPTAEDEAVKFPSTLWGPTCDSIDVIYKDHQLPQLRNGDWLQFPDAGAYTVAGACDFNGITCSSPRTYYINSDSAIDA